MRFMALLHMEETAAPPNPVLWEKMAEYERWGRANGSLLELGGLLPSAEGAIVSLADGRITAVDGPFTETKELVGGYAVIEVRSRDEAVELGRRLMQVHLDADTSWTGYVELRRLAE